MNTIQSLAIGKCLEPAVSSGLGAKGHFL